MKKYFILLGILFSTINLIAQMDSIPNSSNDKTVTITVIGQGKTMEEARTNALKNSIEQVFGSFLSSKTQIINDSIYKDEILSISNGDILGYKIIDEKCIQNVGCVSTLKVDLSPVKLSSYMVKKGEKKIAFDGNLYSNNFKLKEFYKKNEELTISNLIDVCNKVLENAFDFELEAGEPKLNENNHFNINFKLKAKGNQNLNTFHEYLLKSLFSISMTNSEIQSYSNSNISRYGILFLIDYKNYATKITSNTQKDYLKIDYPKSDLKYFPVILRSSESYNMLLGLQNNIISNLFNFKITAGDNLQLFSSDILSNKIIDDNRKFINYFCKPFARIPFSSKSSQNLFYLVEPSWHKENSDLGVNGFARSEDKLKEFYNKMFYLNNEFYESVTNNKMIKSWYPGIGSYYSLGTGDLMYRKPSNIERILLTRYDNSLILMQFVFKYSFSQEQLSNITNFTIDNARN